MTTVLVATDFGEQGARALERAGILCRTLGAELIALHVLPDGLPSDLRIDFERIATTRLKQEVSSVHDRFDVPVSSSVEFGTPWMAILEKADSVNADLLIMGTHSHPGLLDLFRGTTVEKVAKSCDTALLVVADEPTAAYRNVLAATDFSLAAREALEMAMLVAPDAQYRLLHNFSISLRAFLQGRERRDILDAERRRQREDAERAMTTFIGGLKLGDQAADPIIVEGEPVASILSEVRQEATDLLVLGTHSRPRISEALLGSVARSLMSEPPCDILVVPPPFRDA